MAISPVHEGEGMMTQKKMRGISLLGALVAVFVLAAMGGVMSVMVATNQETRLHQIYADQSFASAQAGLEVVLALNYNGDGPCNSKDRNLLGDNLAGNSITVSRTNSRIYVTGTEGDASTAISIVDPIPPSSGAMLEIDTSNAKDASNGAPPKKLIDIVFNLLPGCGNPVTITSLTVSWSPDNGEQVQQVKLDGGVVFNLGGQNGILSGGLVDIDDVTIADASQHVLDFIRWDSAIQNRLYTIQFNYADGSNAVVTVNTQ
jgi:hypothetical protein